MKLSKKEQKEIKGAAANRCFTSSTCILFGGTVVVISAICQNSVQADANCVAAFGGQLNCSHCSPCQSALVC